MRLPESIVKKYLLEKYGLKIPRGFVALSFEEALFYGRKLGFPVVVKADVPAGRRGKAGFVKKVEDEKQMEESLKQTLASVHEGYRINRILVEEAVAVKEEIYLAEYIEGENLTIMLSSSGGVDIEKSVTGVRSDVKGNLTQFKLDHAYGFSPSVFRSSAISIGLSLNTANKLGSIARKMHECFVKSDALLMEFNPIAVLESGDLLILDAKLEVDDNSIYRQEKLVSDFLSTVSMVDETARNLKYFYGLEYAPLDGTIGLISGGAGMTMAVMDAITEHGGSPACFLDCSANATYEGYRKAIRVLLDKDSVKSFIVNIVGGGTQMDEVARIFSKLLQDIPPTKHYVIRFEGTNSEEARKIMLDAGFKCFAGLEESIKFLIEEFPK